MGLLVWIWDGRRLREQSTALKTIKHKATNYQYTVHKYQLLMIMIPIPNTKTFLMVEQMYIIPEMIPFNNKLKFTWLKSIGCSNSSLFILWNLAYELLQILATTIADNRRTALFWRLDYILFDRTKEFIIASIIKISRSWELSIVLVKSTACLKRNPDHLHQCMY